jgi:hypothetical protein
MLAELPVKNTFYTNTFIEWRVQRSQKSGLLVHEEEHLLVIRKNSTPPSSLLQKNASWAEEFFKKASLLTDVPSILPYYKKIDALLMNNDFGTCDALLKSVKTKDLSDVLLIGLLRLTYQWKNRLPSWSSLLVDASKELFHRGYDEKKLLRGLV